MNKYFYIIILSGIIPGILFQQDKSGKDSESGHPDKIILLDPTGNEANNYPEMTIMQDTSENYKSVIFNIEHTFINEFLDLYYIAQDYLRNIDSSYFPEPVYLALTGNQGGYARFGFCLKQDSGQILKKNTPYVDITTGQAMRNPGRLMSITQLLPHEMGHMLIHLLCREDTIDNSRSVDMHYFSVVTDYATAFNEGFAEHIENVSRFAERNDSVRSGIISDSRRIEKKSVYYIKGFRNDFLYPLRLGYFKSSMILWYQQYENYQRYQMAMNGNIRFENATLALTDPEDEITYRNSGVGKNVAKLRNPAQMFSTEGAVNAFFTHLTLSNLSGRYQEPSFYKPFLHDSSSVMSSPEKIFSPLQNQFIKYFKVLHEFVVSNNSGGAQIIDFIKGYIQTFPEEEKGIRNIFRESFGFDFTGSVPPSLWIMVKNHNHRILTMDPFGGITIPVYTFNLNAAGTEDFRTIRGVSREYASMIVRYREENGPFTDLQQLKNIKGVPREVCNMIIRSSWNREYLEKILGNTGQELNISKLILAPLEHLLVRVTIYFPVIFSLLYFLMIRKNKYSVKKIAVLFIRYLLLWTGLVISGLIAVITTAHSPVIILILTLISGTVVYILYANNKMIKMRSLTAILIMSFILFMSVI